MPWEDDWPAYAAGRVAELRARNLEVPESLITPSVKGPNAYLSTAPPAEVLKIATEPAAPAESLEASWPPPRPPFRKEPGEIPDPDRLVPSGAAGNLSDKSCRVTPDAPLPPPIP